MNRRKVTDRKQQHRRRTTACREQLHGSRTHFAFTQGMGVHPLEPVQTSFVPQGPMQSVNVTFCPVQVPAGSFAQQPARTTPPRCPPLLEFAPKASETASVVMPTPRKRRLEDPLVMCRFTMNSFLFSQHERFSLNKVYMKTHPPRTTPKRTRRGQPL